MKKLHFLLILFVISVFTGFPCSQDTIKIMSYNILNYDTDTSRHPYFRTVVQSVNPDILAVEEIYSQNAINTFRDKVMNLIGIGTFAAGTFINGPDSDNGIYFKTTKFTFISNTPIHTELRDINEFKVVYIPTSDTIRLYVVHLKANNTSADQQQRAREVDSLRKFTNTLPAGSNFMVMGDFNIYSANESAYQKLLQVIPGNQGHFFDMYNLPGIWNTQAYAIYHTQSPRVRQFGGGATGGMDDRFDMILYSTGINAQGGITVVPQSLIAYGNDGQHYNDSINRPPNNVVSQNIADALHYGSDHLPVYARFVIQPPISVLNNSEIANKFDLFQNYPNPFNSTTKINYKLRITNDVHLAIFDVTGKEIGVLVNEKQNAGSYSVEWNASDYPSGVYFYKLTSEENSLTKKLILTK
jgi:exonuclease III